MDLAMIKRRRFKQTNSLEERLAAYARRLHNQAKLLRPGPDRERMMRKARQAEIGSHINEWLTSSGLQPPR
jgi:hypothetical protein